MRFWSFAGSPFALNEITHLTFYLTARINIQDAKFLRYPAVRIDPKSAVAVFRSEFITHPFGQELSAKVPPGLSLYSPAI